VHKGNLIKEKCIKGGTYTTEYFYAGKVLKKVHTEFSDTSETFNIWEYDELSHLNIFFEKKLIVFIIISAMNIMTLCGQKRSFMGVYIIQQLMKR